MEGRWVYIDKYRCSECGEEFPIDSPEIVPGKNGQAIHRPPPPSICGSQVRIIKRRIGKTRIDKLREFLDMDINDLANMEIVLEDGKVRLRMPSKIISSVANQEKESK